ALRAMGQFPEALEHYKMIYALAPDSPQVKDGYRGTLIEMGRGEEARLNWYQAIERTNAGFSAWIGYPELCLFLGNEKEYRVARKEMLEQFGSRKDLAVMEPLVRACLLRPSSTRADEVWAEATALSAQTMTAKSDSGSGQRQFAQFLMGLAKYRA